MTNIKGPFRYDIVGSFLRPQRLKEARQQYAQGSLSQSELTAIENEEITTLVTKEKAAGLHAVTDGEFRRRWWHLDFLASLNGISVYDFEASGFGVKRTMQNTYVSAPLSFNKQHPFLDHFAFTKSVAGDTLVKQTIPGPNMVTLDSVVLSAQYHENPVSANLEDLKVDLAQTYQDAIQAFYNAGCRYLQLDDTSWGALFSETHRDRIKSCGYDPDALIDTFADITTEALKNRPEDMTITTHMCKGNFMSHWLYEGTYERIAERLLGIEGFDGFFLEYDDERSGSFEPLRHLKNQKLVLGLVTTKTGTLENPDDVKRRIDEASRYVSLDQLCLSPQCGFSSTEEGNAITDEDQWNKLALIKSIAEDVWKDA